MLYPHNCGHSTSMKVIWGYYLVHIPKWAQWAAKMAILANLFRRERDTTLKPCSTPITAAMKVIWGYYLVHFPKCPKWAQWAAKMAILANILRTERDTTLKPCSAPINAANTFPKKWFGVLFSVQIPKCPNRAQWAAKMAFLANILGTERDTTLKPCSTS